MKTDMDGAIRFVSGEKARKAHPPGATGTSPYLAGASAFLGGVVVGDNPHHEDTDEHWRWMGGWISASILRGKPNKQSTRKAKSQE